MSKLRQALNYLEIIKEAIKLPLTNPKLILSITFFTLLPLNLITLAAHRLNLPPSFEIKREDKIVLEVELVRDVLQWLATTLAISLLSKAYIENPSSILHLLSASQRQWKRVFVTSVFTELIAFNCSSLLLVLGYPLHSNKLGATDFLKFATAMTGFGVLVFVHLACQLSLVVSSVEESSYGLFALRRAVEIIKGRRLQCFVLMALMLLLDALVSAAPVGIVLQLLWCSVYSVLYLESRKNKGTEEEEERWLV